MGIFDLFNQGQQQAAQQPQQQQQQPQQQPATPGNIPPEGNVSGKESDATAANGSIPGGEGEGSPLDKFKELWEPKPNDDGANGEQPVSLDPEKLTELVGQANFTSSLSTEDLQAIVSGGEGAIQALQNAMNQVARQAVIQSTLVSDRLTNNSVTSAVEKLQGSLPDIVRRSNVRETVSSSNPMLNNPAVKPLIDMTQNQLAERYPEASASELATMAQEYVAALGEVFNPSKQQQQSQGNEGEGDINWDKFLGL